MAVEDSDSHLIPEESRVGWLIVGWSSQLSVVKQRTYTGGRNHAPMGLLVNGSAKPQ